MSKVIKALALMSAGLGGYMQGRNQFEDRQAREEDRAYREEQRDRQRKLDSEADALKTSVREAAAPRMAQSAEVYQPTADDEYGPAGALPANPTAGTYKIDERFSPTGARMGAFTDRAAAETAATAANVPGAADERIAAAYMAAGHADKAQALRTGALQSRASTLQIDAAERDNKLREFSRAVVDAVGTGGWDGLAKFATENYNDGFTYKPETTDKGTVLVRYDADGKETGRTADPWKKPEDAIAWAIGKADPTKYVAYRQQEAERERQQGNADRTYDLYKQKFALEEQREGRMASAQMADIDLRRRTLDATLKASEPKPETPDSTFDAKTAAEIAKQVAVEEAKNAGGVDGSGQPLTAEAIAQRATSIVESMRREHTNRFVASTVQRELRVAQSDPAAYALTYAKAAKVMPAEQLAAMGFKPPAAAAAPSVAGAPAPTPRPAPPPAAAAPAPRMSAAPAAPAPAPYQPPANSPAAAALREREAARMRQSQASATREQAQAALAQQASAAAKKAVSAGDARAAAALAQSAGFALLDEATQAEIFKLVNQPAARPATAVAAR
jgi:hypothetical protein